MDVHQKYAALRAQFDPSQRVLVAYSGGIDSTLVLKAASEEIGHGVLGITADSPSIPRRELKQAQRIARDIGVEHRIVSTEELDNPNYS